MPAPRRDYLMSQIDQLRQFVAKLIDGKAGSGLDEMLQLSFSLQEKLFGMPPSEFLQHEVADQITLLNAGETPAAGRDKCLAYANLLRDTAELYAYRGHDDFALGARQLALHVSLCVALAHPEHRIAGELVETLLLHLDPARLHPPVRELLEMYRHS